MPGLTGLARAFKSATRTKGAADGLKSRETLRRTQLNINPGEISSGGKVLPEPVAKGIRDVLPAYLKVRAIPPGAPLNIPWLRRKAKVRDEDFWKEATGIMRRHVDDSFWGESTGLSDIDDLLSMTSSTFGNDPEKFQRFAIIVRMTPDEYIDKAAGALIRITERTQAKAFKPPFTKGDIIRSREKDTLRNADLRRVFINEGDMNIPVLWEKGTIGSGEGQEGLHRAIIAKDFGMDEIPVAIVRKVVE